MGGGGCVRFVRGLTISRPMGRWSAPSRLDGCDPCTPSLLRVLGSAGAGGARGCLDARLALATSKKLGAGIGIEDRIREKSQLDLRIRKVGQEMLEGNPNKQRPHSGAGLPVRDSDGFGVGSDSGGFGRIPGGVRSRNEYTVTGILGDFGRFGAIWGDLGRFWAILGLQD
jgi:hypothetical protein